MTMRLNLNNSNSPTNALNLSPNAKAYPNATTTTANSPLANNVSISVFDDASPQPDKLSPKKLNN
jgi:hypothetical protein